MAITATISVVGPGGDNSGTLIIGQKASANITFTNGNTTAAYVQSVSPYAIVTSSSNNKTAGAFNFGKFVSGPNAPVYVAASGTLTVQVPVTFVQSSSYPIVPTTSVNSTTQNKSVNSNNTYDVGATCLLTDAVTTTTVIPVSPTATTVTVNTVPLPCSN